MVAETLEGLLQSVENPVEAFRNNNMDWQSYVFEPEYTNWIEEQRAVRESVAVVDQSYHMEILRIEGRDAVELLSKVGANDFDSLREEPPPQARNILLCNPDGYVIGDSILFHLREHEFAMVGNEIQNNWVRYHVEKSDLQVDADIPYHHADDHDPPDFRFQVQGPHAMDVMEEVVDGPLPEIPFFGMDMIEINGVETFALAHGMAAMPGLEIFGPYECHDEIFDEIFEAGEQYDIRQMGTKAYKTGKISSGWFV
jgi:vanillate/3-O-methylgallate O-demethylase